MMKKKITLKIMTGLLFLLLTVSMLSGQANEQQDTQTIALPVGSDSVIFDDDVVEAEIIIRVPESSIQPRTKTEEIDFTLNYLRQLIINSNQELY
jgi:hypothetical protein